MLFLTVLGHLRKRQSKLEQKCRDTKSAASDHQCSVVDNITPVPSPWRSFLSCRKCKKSEYLAVEFLKIAPSFRHNNESNAFSISADRLGLGVPCQHLHTNAVWLHCSHTLGPNKLIYSYWTHHVQHPKQGSRHHSSRTRTEALIEAVCSDPDLSGIPRHKVQALQTTYVCTGCDYVHTFSTQASLLATQIS